MNIVNGLGTVYIADDVIASIAGMSTSQCNGVVGITSKRITGGILELLGLDNIMKGVRVANKKEQLTVDLYIIVKLGLSIQEIAQTVTTKIRNDIMYFTGLEVSAINIIVEGIEF